MNNVYLFQPQYAVDVRKETNYWLPYSIACVWSYAQQFDFVRDNFTLIDTIFNRRHINELLLLVVIYGMNNIVWKLLNK